MEIMKNMDRYEEARERARAGKPIDEVFPELKESEDERIRKMLIDYFSDEDTTNGFSNNTIRAWLERLKEPQPAEWSEEDKDAINGAIGILLQDNNPTFVFPEYSKLSVGEIVKKLKSLRPQPHWKPSEEQMKALRAAMEHNVCYCGCNQHALKSLYYDLKKLL